MGLSVVMNEAYPNLDLTSLWPMLAAMVVVAGVLHIWFAILLMVLARKTGTANGWLALLPVLNLFLMCMVGRRSCGWVLAMFVPFLNVIAFAYIWGGIAAARNQSPWLGLLMLVPLVNLLLPLILCFGPATGYAPVAAQYVSAGPMRGCGKCGQSAGESDAFCAHCGSPFGVAVSPVRKQVPVQPMVMAPRPATAGSGCWIVLIVMGLFGVSALGCCGVGGYFLLAPKPYTPPVRQLAQLPPAMAGSMSLLPRDSVSEGQAAPASIASQTFGGPGAATRPRTVSLPPEQFPRGIDVGSIPQVASDVTSAVYRTGPTAPPVSIQILNMPNAAASAENWVSQAAQATGGVTTPVTIRSPNGQEFSGTQIESSTDYICILTSYDDGTTVFVSSRSGESAAIASRLAGNLGNSGGLSDPQVEPYICVLPAIAIGSLEIVELFTATGDGIMAVAANLSPEEASDPQLQQAIAQFRQFVPAFVTAAVLEDSAAQEWNALVGTYATVGQATRIWRLIEWTAGWGATGRIAIHGTNGLWFDETDGRIVLFQKGPHVVVLRGPVGVPLDQLIALGEGLQL
jgi:hypothetical protein